MHQWRCQRPPSLAPARMRADLIVPDEPARPALPPRRQRRHPGAVRALPRAPRRRGPAAASPGGATRLRGARSPPERDGCHDRRHDTPGARAARVHEFIDTLLADWSPDDERARFLAGLADVDARARAAFGADFLGATEAQRVTLLTQLDAEAQAARPAKPDSRQPPFFQQMKFLTVFGYCTSEVGAKAELHYETIPGAYDGCRPFAGWRANPGDF